MPLRLSQQSMFRCFFAAAQFIASFSVRPSFGLNTVKTMKFAFPQVALIEPSGIRFAIETRLHVGKFSLMILLATVLASPFGAAPTLKAAPKTLELSSATAAAAMARQPKLPMFLPMIFTVLWHPSAPLCLCKRQVKQNVALS